jgi:hypothetical protein
MDIHYGPQGVHAELQSRFDRLVTARPRTRTRRPRPSRAR